MAFGMDMAANAANGILGQGMSLLFGGMQDKRQLKQQGKLQDLQIKGNKEMADYQQDKAMQMWKDTNYGAQVDEMKKAGLSISGMYGGSGAGGATTGGASAGGVSGGSAGDPNSGMGMGLQLASQLALQKAQKENIEADTANKKAGAGLSTAQTDTEKENAELKGNERTISDRTMKEQEKLVEQKALAAELENKLTKIKTEGGSIENRKNTADAIIKEFEAEMTKSGISPNAPWYTKFLTELLNKIGLNPLK